MSIDHEAAEVYANTTVKLHKPGCGCTHCELSWAYLDLREAVKEWANADKRYNDAFMRNAGVVSDAVGMWKGNTEMELRARATCKEVK